MAIEANPTRTRTIENKWLRDINRRWKKFTTDSMAQLVNINKSNLEVNQETPFTLDASQIRVYMAFYQDMIDSLLLGTTDAPNWQAEYQLQSYMRGVERARGSLISQGADLIPTAAETFAAQGLAPFTAIPTLGAMPTLAPIHSDSLEFLFSRSYDSLKKWTDAMTIETREILVSAGREGKGIREVTKDITDRISVSKSRAERIARTEINQAYSVAQINEVNRASEELDEDIKTRWITAVDGHVRHSHANVHGVVMDTERASKIKSTDGINCRCALTPVLPDAPGLEKKNEKFKKERKHLIKLESK